MLTAIPWIVILIVTVFPGPKSQKSKASTTVQEDPCPKAMTQSDLDECGAQQYKKADVSLNAIYQELLGLLAKNLATDKYHNDFNMVRFDETAIEGLKNTERLWIRSRDSQCDAAEQQIDGGSMAPKVGAICLTEVTSHRRDELKDVYENPSRTLE